MPKPKNLLNACPHAPDYVWDWSGLMFTPVGALLSRMKDIPQNPIWHGEGDVYRHTRLVCEALAADPAFSHAACSQSAGAFRGGAAA